MPRHLPEDEPGSALHRGASVEQLLGLRADGGAARVAWLEIRPVPGGFEVHRFDVVDHGGPDRLDVYAWIDGDSEQESSRFETPGEALAFAAGRWRADPRKWVNQGVLQDEYREAILMLAEARH